MKNTEQVRKCLYSSLNIISVIQMKEKEKSVVYEKYWIEEKCVQGVREKTLKKKAA